MARRRARWEERKVVNNDLQYRAGIEAEMSLAHEAVSQLHARLQGQQIVLQTLLQHFGIDRGKLENWAIAMAGNDISIIAEQAGLICQAIRALPAGTAA